MSEKLFLVSFLFSFLLILTRGAALPGKWVVLQQNVGISSMHMQLLYNDRVIMFDRTDFGSSNISLPPGKCLKTDCTAHSIEYNALTNTFRPLMVQSDTWCSSGSVMPDGQLVQTGGFNKGERVVRTFTPCNRPTCDWVEFPNALNVKRWYSTNQLLPDNTQIVIGGTGEDNYEYYPKTATNGATFNLTFLTQTYDKGVLNNLYPFVYLCPDGNLFIFANNRAILYNYKTQTVVKTYPTIPGGDPRSYPSTGSSVLLPLKNLESKNIAVEVIICGGAPKGSFLQASKGTFVKALNNCARMKITDANPQWAMETMPYPRVNGDMTLLPNGNVLILNGGSSGVAGWELGRDPVLNPVMYITDNVAGKRFEVQTPTTIPRMYHSTASLLRDGRVLVAGSNPHSGYVFTGVLYPTELRLEAFSPSYLDATNDALRPKVTIPKVSNTVIGYGKVLLIRFQVAGTLNANKLTVTMVSPAFNTHSLSMNHRLLVLTTQMFRKLPKVGPTDYEIRVLAPPSAVIAPSGFYMCFVNHQQVPSKGFWVQIK